MVGAARLKPLPFDRAPDQVLPLLHKLMRVVGRTGLPATLISALGLSEIYLADCMSEWNLSHAKLQLYVTVLVATLIPCYNDVAVIAILQADSIEGHARGYVNHAPYWKRLLVATFTVSNFIFKSLLHMVLMTYTKQQSKMHRTPVYFLAIPPAMLVETQMHEALLQFQVAQSSLGLPASQRTIQAYLFVRLVLVELIIRMGKLIHFHYITK